MKEYKRNAQTQKILDGLEIAYLRLLEYKKKINSDLVILKDGKIIRVKP